jgi:hypothetical protein
MGHIKQNKLWTEIATEQYVSDFVAGTMHFHSLDELKPIKCIND